MALRITTENLLKAIKDEPGSTFEELKEVFSIEDPARERQLLLAVRGLLNGGQVVDQVVRGVTCYRCYEQTAEYQGIPRVEEKPSAIDKLKAGLGAVKVGGSSERQTYLFGSLPHLPITISGDFP